MPPAVITGVSVASIAAYITLALVLRARSLRWRGASLARGSGPSVWLPYFLPAPYLVIALRPGPELDIPDALRWIGLSFVIDGVVLAAWAAVTLGRHFDMEVEVHRGHELVRSGPYAFVRHPIYLGLAAHLLGACLATGNLLLIAGVVLGALPAFVWRAREEERLLRASGIAPP